ncbi:hypothetical protein F4678DRAFT_18303 [Xylaria arbuscula]|nr:hypothetical protein F4678DRAFT_18303 [Xylaria arbuscula]
MDNTRTQNDDYNTPLGEIAKLHDKPIINLLLDIQETQEPQQKFFNFIKHLECFCLGSLQRRSRDPDKLRPREHRQRKPIFRRRINAFKDREFVAVSYTSDPTDEKEDCKKSYRVENRNGRMFYPSTVRDCVWDRVFKYMHNRGVELLWIDRQSIWQQECKGLCTHKECRQKKAALHTMDIVYTLSHHPVGLLEMSICSIKDLNALETIMRGQLTVRHENPRLRLPDAKGLHEAQKALKLLAAIINDKWWKRAWIFQEAYLARRELNLLIRHPPDLEIPKRDSRVFGGITGELCIKFDDFLRRATKLCQALQPYSSMPAIDDVLAAAASYRMLLKDKRSMTPQIIKDVIGRDLERASDRLSIIANCCAYPIRLNFQAQERHSSSLCVLATSLLNGEVLHNSSEHVVKWQAAKMTVSEYLKAHLFQNFNVPKSKSSLTFKKSCRFSNVHFERQGVLTTGQVWKLGAEIKTATFPGIAPRRKDHSRLPTPHQQDRLAQLAKALRSMLCSDLADDIETYLDHSSDGTTQSSFGSIMPQEFLHLMAEEVVRAIDNKKTLRLASLYGSQSTAAYTAIFIWDHENVGDALNPCSGPGDSGREQQPTDFAFTSFGGREKGKTGTDHHVLLQVECRDLRWQRNSDKPRLYIKRWLPGVCFRAYPNTDVIFPWPSELETIK